ncbi:MULTISPECIES: TRAP transporter substrate-binding protein [Cohnella]|uniref:TRAP transporter substrate-binding protein n=1 Tax=Cohnella TaxID=329857 RepID=UPI0009BAECE9|nr:MULTISPECIES: TRAP transporter substrate-binding protein [Cohnella]MBN2981375.1 TRAP transporter substrate-binding protein [Cohnella algarum]
MKKKVKLGMVMTLIAALLAACGGGNSGSNASESPAASSGSSSPAASASGETSGAFADPVTFKFANITKEGNAYSNVGVDMDTYLNEKTGGRVSFQQFPGGQLGNEADMMQQLNTGALDFAVITTAQLSNSSPDFGAWLMPFLVDSHQQAYELWTSDESMALFDSLTSENVVGLGYASAGFRYLLATKPIETAADLANMKLRTTPSPTILDFMNGLKVSPTPMPLTEVYMSLQTGVIDGVDIDTQSLITENLTEIAKHMTPSKHMYWAAAILVNKDRWNGFSEEEKQLVQEAVTVAMENNVKFNEETEAKLNETGAADYGITIHQLKDPSEFDAVVQSVYDKWTAQSDKIAKFVEKAQAIKAQG